MLLVTCVCNLQFHLQVVRISFGQDSLISFALIELTVVFIFVLVVDCQL